MGTLFGTDGVRGVANVDLTPELAYNLGRAAAIVLGKLHRQPAVVIGKDTRLSGDMLENALTAGILSMGGNVIKIGVMPTPAVARLVRIYDAQAGIVISASHNPYQDNGIKFFNGEGYKLSDEIEEDIESYILGEKLFPEAKPEGEALGKEIDLSKEAELLYIEYLLSTADYILENKKVVLDCANGASYKIAPKVFERLGAEVVTIGDSPNGVNINDKIGSTHPELLQETVLREKADIGLAYDGDADRLIVVDEEGKIIDGDKTICICAKMLSDMGQLANNLVTATVMSNIGFHRFVENMGASVEITNVGDRYVLESMLKTGCVIGGEQSGHIIFRNYSTTGDGILSSLQFIKAMVHTGKKGSELSEEVELYPQVLVNARVSREGKTAYKKDEEIISAVSAIEDELEGEGRVLIRPSGTESLVRVMIEGRNKEQIEEFANNLAELIREKYGE
ncbi:MAG: phosphoglucosamine mutase [Hornefia sp.]|nr:phosphoglucosamine mutase [Hornefia sp.]